MKYTVTPVPATGLLARKQKQMYEVRDANGMLALTCETRRSADRWAAKFEKEIKA